MIFKKDEKVKAFVELGLQKEKSWQVVRYIEPIRNTGHWCSYGGQTFSVGVNEVLRFTEVDQDKVDAFGKDQAKSLLETLKNAVAHFQLTHLFGEITLQEDESIIHVGSEFVTIEPGITEKRTIGGFVEHPCWSVDVWRRIPQTREEPEDIDQCNAGVAMNAHSAAQLAIEVILKEQLKDYFDALGEAAAYTELGSNDF